jgi:hypothetical protein
MHRGLSMKFKKRPQEQLLLLPIIDLLQQFEDYVKGIALQKRPKKYIISKRK